MSEALVLFGDTERSTDLFRAVPVGIVDPFLYVETDGRRIAVVSPFEHEGIRGADPGIEIVDTEDYDRRALLESGLDWTEAALEVARRACRDLGITRATVSWDFPHALAELLRADGVEIAEDHRAVEALRRVKTPAQIDGVRRAQAAADAAMAEAARLVRECAPGLTAEAVRASMQRVCDSMGCGLEDGVIVAVNEQAARGHDSGSGPIVGGDIVLVDIWPRDRASRCFADMTRTFVAAGAEPPEELVSYWRLSREALDAVVAAVRPGVNGRELYDLSAAVFEAAGHLTLRTGKGTFEDGYTHSLGHGVGLDVHEAPSLGLAGDDLVAGDVIAVEPGCYRQGFGGARLEDLLLVTADGCEILTDFPYQLAP